MAVVQPDARAASSAGPAGLWSKIKGHKVVEWTLAYVAFGYALLHGAEMVQHAFNWPEAVVRFTVFGLLLGMPVAVTLAYYHGHRAENRVSRIEIAILTSLLVIAGSALWFLSRSAHEHNDVRVAAPAGRIATTPEPTFSPPAYSVAVLPFANLSGDPKQEYFSDGMTEELINALSQIESLQVIARTSSFSFKGQSVDIDTIARKLNVGAVLEGSIRRSGNTVRVTVQLINAVTGFHLWSHDYDRDLKNVLELQTDIATTVAQQLQARLVGDEAGKIEAGGTRNAEAHEAYLRGVELLNFTDSLAEGRSAVAALDEAVALDSNFADAYARRAQALRYTADFSLDQKEIAQLHQMALASAERAVELAPNSADAHVALGWYAMAVLLDFKGAARELDRALALKPGSAFVQHAYSSFQSNMGHAESALTAIRRAIALDPQNYLYQFDLGVALYNARRFSEVPPVLRELAKFKPDGTYASLLAVSYIALGTPERARSLCEDASTPMAPGNRPGCLALAYYALGRPKDAEREFQQLRAIGGDSAAVSYAGIYAQAGDHAQALRWLNTAERLRAFDLVTLRVNWIFDPIRNEPGFKALEQRLNFPP
jgi:serine/threonine-protein kinase